MIKRTSKPEITSKRIASKAADMLDGHFKKLDRLENYIHEISCNAIGAGHRLRELRKLIKSLAGSALTQREKK